MTGHRGQYTDRKAEGRKGRNLGKEDIASVTVPRRNDEHTLPPVGHSERRTTHDTLCPAAVAQHLQGTNNVVHRRQLARLAIKQRFHVFEQHPWYWPLASDSRVQEAEDVPHKTCALHATTVSLSCTRHGHWFFGSGGGTAVGQR
jgi:hypothetical protein